VNSAALSLRRLDQAATDDEPLNFTGALEQP